MGTRFSFFLTFCLILGGAADPNSGFAGDEPKPPTTIQVAEIGRTIRALGQLGFPLRDVVSVQGSWVELTDGPAKPGSTLWFRVTEVNGQQLDKPVSFRGIDVKVVEKGGKSVERVKGEQWELRAYETWPDYGHPAEFDKEMGVVPASPPAQGATRLFGLLKRRTTR